MDLNKLVLPPSVNKDKNQLKTYSFEVTLAASNDATYPEVSWKELVKRHTLKSTPAAPLNPYASDDEDELAALAARFEEKYSTEVVGSTRKRKIRLGDYVDRGAGYDEEDSFIDNEDMAKGDVVPAELEPILGGFYINSGRLEFKKHDLSDLEIDEDDLDQLRKLDKSKSKGPSRALPKKKANKIKNNSVPNSNKIPNSAPKTKNTPNSETVSLPTNPSIAKTSKNSSSSASSSPAHNNSKISKNKIIQISSSSGSDSSNSSNSSDSSSSEEESSGEDKDKEIEILSERDLFKKTKNGGKNEKIELKTVEKPKISEKPKSKVKTVPLNPKLHPPPPSLSPSQNPSKSNLVTNNFNLASSTSLNKSNLVTNSSPPPLQHNKDIFSSSLKSKNVQIPSGLAATSISPIPNVAKKPDKIPTQTPVKAKNLTPHMSSYDQIIHDIGRGIILPEKNFPPPKSTSSPIAKNNQIPGQFDGGMKKNVGPKSRKRVVEDNLNKSSELSFNYNLEAKKRKTKIVSPIQSGSKTSGGTMTVGGTSLSSFKNLTAGNLGLGKFTENMTKNSPGFSKTYTSFDVNALLGNSQNNK